MSDHKRHYALLTGILVMTLGAGLWVFAYALLTGQVTHNEWIFYPLFVISVIAGLHFLVLGLFMVLGSQHTDWKSSAHNGASDIVSAILDGFGKLAWALLLLGLAVIGMVAAWSWLSTVLTPTAIILGSLLLLILVALIAVYAKLGEVVAALKAKPVD